MRLPGTVSRNRGFTLLEVLVALAVLALALAAIIEAGGSYAANQAYMRDRVMAHWVARNLLTEKQIRNEWPSIGDSTGEDEMGGRHWAWRIDVTQTEDEDLRRLDIEVRPDKREDDESPLASLAGFLAKPE